MGESGHRRTTGTPGADVCDIGMSTSESSLLCYASSDGMAYGWMRQPAGGISKPPFHSGVGGKLVLTSRLDSIYADHIKLIGRTKDEGVPDSAVLAGQWVGGQKGATRTMIGLRPERCIH